MRLAIHFLGILLISITTIPFSAQALEMKGSITKSGRKDSKQFCYTTFTITQDGVWTALTKFSNGKEIDGDNFVAIMVVRDNNGNPLATINHRAGVKGSLLSKRAIERSVPDPPSSGVLPKEVVSRIDASKTTYVCSGRNTFPDELAAKVVISLFEKFGW